MTRHVLDADTHRLGDGPLVFGGRPPRLFRLSGPGVERFEQIAAGGDVGDSQLAARLLDAAAIHPLARPAPERLAATTCVIPVRDGDREALAALVASLPDVARVIVVDDGSATPIAARGGVDVLRVETPRGPAGARNAGWGAATTELVAFVDSDVRLPEPGWLETLLGHADDPHLGAVAPRVVGTVPDGRLAGYERRHGPLDLGPFPRLVGPGSPVSYVPAAALVVRRAALEAIGGFDESLRFGEDVDAVWRLGEAGWTVRYDPSVRVEHEPRRTWHAWLQQRWSYGCSAGPLAARHPDALPALRLTSPAPWATLLAAAGHLGTASVLAVGASVRFGTRLHAAGLDGRTSVATTARMAWRAHVETARQFARVVRRTWWPAVAFAAPWSRRARRLAVIAAAAALADVRPVHDAPLSLIDDLAYGAGVWSGALRTRQPSPVLPSLRPPPRLPPGSVSPRARVRA